MKLFHMINEAGVHQHGLVPRICDTAFGLNALVKKGVAAGSVAVTSAATDIPTGLCAMPPDQAGDTVTIERLTAQSTKLVKLGGDVSEEDWLIPAADGTAAKLPTDAGTYYVFGKALSAGVSGQVIEAETFAPRPVVVGE